MHIYILETQIEIKTFIDFLYVLYKHLKQNQTTTTNCKPSYRCGHDYDADRNGESRHYLSP